MIPIFKMYLLIPAISLTLLKFNSTVPPSGAGYKAGEIASDFKLRNTDGKMVSLSDYKNCKGYIVVFTCNHCPFAKAYEQRVINLHQKYSSAGFPLIAISSNDKNIEPEDSYENMQAKHYPFPYLYDETQEIAHIYGATRTPHVFLLQKTNKGNKVVYVGAIDDNYEDASDAKDKYLENAIAEISSGKKVTLDHTKALGCTIKWKKTMEGN